MQRDQGGIEVAYAPVSVQGFRESCKKFSSVRMSIPIVGLPTAQVVVTLERNQNDINVIKSYNAPSGDCLEIHPVIAERPRLKV